MAKQKLTTQQTIKRLASKFPSPQYGFITQVRNGTGYGASRTADAMAMSLWPSRGLHVSGFEVKVSRADWLKELKTPEKADEIAMYCHYWYLVVGDESIVKLEELPQKWGLIIPSGKGLKILKEAPFDDTAIPFDHLMLAGVFRNIAEQCTPNEVIADKIEAARESGKQSSSYACRQNEEDIKRLKKNINDFETHSGIKMSNLSYRAKDVGEAVEAVLTGKDKLIEKKLKELHGRAKNIVKFLEGEDIDNYKL